MQSTFPARIHVLLARDSHESVVIRRGPSKLVCFVGWNRRSDTFEPTQWLKGRVYERRSDLSPNGRYLIYFAMNGKWQTEAKGAWTAISRSPWMKAIALLAKGDCWHGGGLFLDDRTYWLNDGCGHEVLKQTNEVKRDLAFNPSSYYGGECPGVYYIRLQRDNWKLIDIEALGRWDRTYIFEKELSKQWILRKLAHQQSVRPVGKGCYWDEHQLINRSGEVRDYPEWEWADWDGQRILWASNGCLYSGSISTGSRLGQTKLLYDFNAMRFCPTSAPY